MAHTPSTWIELNKTALDHNIAQIKNIIGASSLAFVIKANAYGHGMLSIASMIDNNPLIDMVCVANLSDAIKLSNQGLSKPILVLSCIDDDPEKAINTKIVFAVYNMPMIAMLNTIGTAHNYRFPIHLKIDTGLSRLGIKPADTLEAIKTILSYRHLELQGIYSHFAESNKVDSPYTTQQIETFNTLLKTLHQENIHIPYKHLANSAATMKFSLPHCNMVRVGAGIYGLWPSPETRAIAQGIYPHFNITPILEWKTTIINIQHINEGQYVGYDRTFQANRPMRIACVPVGYFDGFDFRLYNQAEVKIDTHYARIVGRISMNLTTIDVTDIPYAQIGTEVSLMGNDSKIHPYTLGMIAGNPNVRELVTKINAAITRIIIEKEIFQNEKIPYTTSRKNQPTIED